jgi:hypothetical protein
MRWCQGPIALLQALPNGFGRRQVKSKLEGSFGWVVLITSQVFAVQPAVAR